MRKLEQRFDKESATVELQVRHYENTTTFNINTLSAEDLRIAETAVIRQLQREAFPDLFQLQPVPTRALKTDRTISDYLAHNRIQWKYSASLAPWWGGFWERMVRTVKKLFRKSIGTQVLDRDELETALINIECVINERPLTYLSDEVGEQQPLTPAQLLLGHGTSRRRAKPTRPVAATRASRDELLSMDRARQAQILEWWRRWIKDYLHELSNFQSKGSTSSRKIQLGDLVVIHKDNIKRIR